MNFKTRYTAERLPVEIEGESMTQQQFRDDADINLLVDRYTEHPEARLMDKISPRVPMFGDYSDVGDLQRNYNKVLNAEEMFFDMPAKFRARFANNPLNLLEFLADPDNRDEALKLGLLRGDVAPVGADVASVSAVNRDTVVDNASRNAETQLSSNP
ncbi:VP3 [Gokushovirus WZ-2015a]|nr:VP3 [Gokushovirus WZ-2015a]